MAVTDKNKMASKTTAKSKAASAKAKATPGKPAVTKPKNASATKEVTKAALVNGKSQEKVKVEMSNLKEKAADTARNAAERGKERASEAVSGIGKLIRDSAGSIDESVGKNYGDYARSAADAFDKFAGKMDTKQVDEIVGDARDFVRKSPAVAIGAAAAIGFVLSRLIRSGRDDA